LRKKHHPYDAVIVGGGHNGLVAAAYLARAGQSVLLLERDFELGGGSTSKAVFPGMDAHLSRYAYLVSLLPESIIRDLGLDFTCRRRRIASCVPYRRGTKDDALLLSSDDDTTSRASLLRLSGEHDVRGYGRLLELQRALVQKVWPSLLQPLRSREEWSTSMQSPLEREAWNSFVERPLGGVIEAHIQNDILRGAILTDGKIGVFTHARDPSLLQNRCYILHVVGGGNGEWKVPVGGMGALVAALTDAARRGGAEIRTDAQVEAIHPGTPSHTVVIRHRDTEHTVEAARVLVNAGPQVQAELLGEPYVPRPGDEGSVCKINILLRRLPRLRAAGVAPRDAFTGTFRVGESYSQMHQSYFQAAAGQIPDRPPYEMYCHTLTDPSILGPSLRDAGYHTLTLFALDLPYRLFGSANEATRSAVLERCLRDLNEVLAEPVEHCIAVDANGDPCVEIKSPVDLERELVLNRGNIFHDEPSWFFTDDPDAAGTWGAETAHERIYLCGSSMVRGGAVSGIPGHNAATCILEEINNRRHYFAR
jgi:phytoene dehydrogenase-like protein